MELGAHVMGPTFASGTFLPGLLLTGGLKETTHDSNVSGLGNFAPLFATSILIHCFRLVAIPIWSDTVYSEDAIIVSSSA